MRTPTRSRSTWFAQLRSITRYRAGLLLLVPVLVLAACVASAPVQRHTAFPPTGGCRADVVMNDLLSRHPGVRVFPAGGGVQVRVRGALQDPLYVLDGQPLSASPWGARPVVNPCDIQEIRVLSDPADLTFYGLRAANGVVLITTRKR
jgi:TonB-dependent SusC/RagA subfamily outer membrane receptor